MNFRVLWDQLEDCPYRAGQVARLPLRMPLAAVTPDEFDACLEAGDRRSGRMLYRTMCPACSACHPLRVPVADFRMSKSQRRVYRRNAADVTVEVGMPELSWERLHLYNRHKQERGLSADGTALNAYGYRTWLVDSCTDTREVRYLVDRRLIGISILDLGKTSVSSVYHFFDPDESARSLGVYSVLKELEIAAERGYQWYYLGFYVSDCDKLRYKASYYPHERKVDGAWVPFTGSEAG